MSSEVLEVRKYMVYYIRICIMYMYLCIFLSLSLNIYSIGTVYTLRYIYNIYLSEVL